MKLSFYKPLRHILRRCNVRITYGKLHHEPVELGFRQRIGSGHLSGILCTDHHKGFRYGYLLPVNRDLMLLHDFQEGGLGFGGGSVQLVGKHYIIDDRTRQYLKGSVGGPVNGETCDVRGRRVGRALDPREGERQRIRQGFRERGLPHAGDILQEQMAARQEGDDHLVYDVAFPDDAFFDALFQS